MQARHATALALTLAALAAGPADAGTRCEAGNLGLPEQIACAKAAESTTAVRQYVQRTRALHGLYVWDFVKREDPRAAQPASARVADRSAASSPVADTFARK